MRSILLQDWTTVRANAVPAAGGGVSTVTQAQGEWFDVSSFGAATFWIDAAQVIAPSGANIALTLQTAPTLDEAYFLPVAPAAYPLISNPSGSPQIVQSVGALGLVPLARYLRWQLTTDSPTVAGTWGATFRIRVAPSLHSFFRPSDVNGCVLWLRSDLGITVVDGGVTGWADQSGAGHNADDPVRSPPYITNAMNGAPALEGNGSASYWMQTSAFTLGANATLFAAAQPSTGTQNGYARLIEHQYNATYMLGCDTTGTHYQLIVNDNTAPYGTAIGGNVTSGVNTIVSGMYSSTTGTGTLFVNGAAVASGSFTAPTPTSLQMSMMQDYNNSFTNYWAGYFAEALVYNRALSSSEMTGVHRYLAGRYGVAM